MFYDRFVALCESRGVTPSRAAIDAGLSKSTVTKWKHHPESRPTGKAIEALTGYFGITVSELLEEPPAPEPVRTVSDEDLRFALFGGSDEITDEMYREVLSFAAFVKEREAKKRNG